MKTTIDWKRKLSSRKFWAALIGFLTPLLIFAGVSESVVTQVASIIMSGGSLIAYIIAEGWVDAANTGSGDTETGAEVDTAE